MIEPTPSRPFPPFGGIRLRLALAIGLLTAVAAVAMSMVVGEHATRQVETDKGAMMAELAYQMGDRLDKDVFERWREVQGVAGLDPILDPAVPAATKRRRLEALQATYRDYAWLGFTDRDGRVAVGSGGLLEGVDVSTRTWFTEGRRGPHAGDVHDAFLLAKLLPKPAGDPLPLRLVDVSAPLMGADGQLLGVLCGHLSWGWAASVRRSLLVPLRDHKEVEVLVLNSRREILLGTPALPPDSAPLTVPSARLASEGGNGSVVEEWPDGRRYLTGYARADGHLDYPGMGWLALVRQPEEEAFAAAYRLRDRTLAMVGGAALVLVLLLSLVVGRIVRPMQLLAAAADRIRRGEAAAAIPLLHGSDEAGVLSRSLAALVATQEAQKGALQALNAELRRDIELRREAEERLRLSARVFECSREGIIITDAERRILTVNRAFSGITGFAVEEVVGRDPRLLRSGRHGPEFYADMRARLRRDGTWQGEIWNRRKSGEVYPEWLTISAVRDEAGAVTHYIGLFTDITERKAAEERILHLAQHDALTDLPNRLLFLDRLGQTLALARRHGSGAALLFIDLDFFKHVNDSLGHYVGDQLLQQVAGRLAAALGEGETVARLGGDEFVVLLPEVAAAEEAGHVAERLLAALAEPLTLTDYRLTVTASIGIALHPADGDDAVALMRNCDTAMYSAKGAGRNQYRFFTAGMNRQVHERLVLEHALRGALERGELALVYQPQIELASGRMVGVEALLRWEHPTLGAVSPAKFIPIAEEIGAIGAIGEWVLRNACRQQRQWREAGVSGLRLGVNLSSVQFRQQDLHALVAEVVAAQECDPALLELEITEGAILDSAPGVAETLAALKRLGVRIALDDFGTGYSGLSYLRRFSIDTVKIDQSFVRELAVESSDAEIVAAIVAMAHRLRLAVIAEGVEQAEQLEFLRSLGCDEVQGYYLSRPVAAERIAALWRGEGALVPPAP